MSGLKSIREMQLGELNHHWDMERRVFLLTGLYPRRPGEHVFLYHWRTVLLCLLSSPLAISMITQLSLGFDDISEVTDIMYYLMTQAAYLWKLAFFLKGRKLLLDIEDLLDKDIMHKYLHHGRDFLAHAIFTVKIGAVAFRSSIILVVILYSAFPLLDEEGRDLPFAGWYPIDKKKFQAPIFVFQIACLCLSAFINSNIDIMTAYLMGIAISSLMLLKKCLRNVDYADQGVAKDGKIVARDLEDLLLMHEHIITYITLIEDMFSMGIFIQFLASIGVICLTGFQMLVVPVASAQFLVLISYIMCMMCQVAMYCWYGNEILFESDGITDACYLSNWYEGTQKSKKVLCLIMERSKRQIILTAGKFFTLSLTTLLVILKSSYSYFAVLQRVYKDE